MRAVLGYAADARGRGVAYARVRGNGGERVERCVFRVARRPGNEDREIGFAALEAMLVLLRSHGSRIAVQLEDAELVADLTQRRTVPVALMLPYVRTRCALNAFASWRLVAGSDASDLSARAAAEVSLSVAA